MSPTVSFYVLFIPLWHCCDLPVAVVSQYNHQKINKAKHGSKLSTTWHPGNVRVQCNTSSPPPRTRGGTITIQHRWNSVGYKPPMYNREGSCLTPTEWWHHWSPGRINSNFQSFCGRITYFILGVLIIAGILISIYRILQCCIKKKFENREYFEKVPDF